MIYTYHEIMIADYNRTEYVSLEHACDWMSYCRLHSDMDTPQYVYVDVLSDVPFVWMFYYTLHSDMDAPQYVHVDVPSK
jgi:hypothetical protein